MIIDDLYQGYDFGTGHGKWTNPIITIPIEAEDFSDAYYLGWISFENVPNNWKTSVYYFDSTAGVLSFNDISIRQNVSIGFAGQSASGPAPTYGHNYRYLEDTGYTGYADRWGNTWGTSTDPANNYGPRLLNKWMPLSTSYKNLRFTLHCLYSPWANNLSYGDRCVTSTMSIADFISFMRGDTLLNFTFDSGLVYTLSGPDFVNGYYLDENNDRRIIITSYEFFSNPFYNPDNDLESDLFSGVFGQSDYYYNDEKVECITSGTTVDKTWLSTEYGAMFNFRSFNDIGTSWTICADKTSGANTDTLIPQGTPFGGLITGEITQTQMDSLTAQGKYIEMENNNYLIYGLREAGTDFKIVHGYTPSEIYKHAALFRWTPNSKQYGYEAGVVYFPKIDLETNEFLCELITGTRAEVEPQLPEWFKRDDPTISDYNDEQKPGYEPEPSGPTPQETEPKYPGAPTRGFAIRYALSPGVHFYALTNSDLEDFIQRLWSQPKSFYEAVQIAGKQVNSIFDYIQSFRFYPLNYDFSGSDDTQPVIFGTGAVLKQADGTTNFQLKQSGRIQRTIIAGEWDLSNPIYHWRDNFLDYSPYLKMSIYLPYAGTIELSPEAVASHTNISTAKIKLVVSFDIETGSITYYVVNQADTLLVQKTAKIAIDLSLSGNNATEQSAAILRAQFSTIKQLLGAGTSIATGAVNSGITGAAKSAVGAIGSLGDMYLQNSLAQRAIPVEIQGMGGTFSALAGGQYPYITINRQKVSNPSNYGHTTGYLVEGAYRINNLKGLTICRNVDISGIGKATDKEKAQIKQIMESGFYA